MKPLDKLCIISSQLSSKCEEECPIDLHKCRNGRLVCKSEQLDVSAQEILQALRASNFSIEIRVFSKQPTGFVCLPLGVA